MSDEYRTVTATARMVTERAVLIDTKDGARWVPRPLIHGADDITIQPVGLNIGDAKEWTFRLRDWKAEELGLAG
jgi:hypothetical protein